MKQIKLWTIDINTHTEMIEAIPMCSWSFGSIVFNIDESSVSWDRTPIVLDVDLKFSLLTMTKTNHTSHFNPKASSYFLWHKNRVSETHQVLTKKRKTRGKQNRNLIKYLNLSSIEHDLANNWRNKKYGISKVSRIPFFTWEYLSVWFC